MPAATPATATAPSAPAPVLEVAGLRKSFRSPEGGLKSVVSVDAFRMAAGAQVGMKGVSGSGKTTFLNLLSGIIRADAGSIRIDGTELTALSESRRDRLRATTLGCVYQSFNLLQGYTCLENVLLAMSFGAGRDRAFATSLLHRVGLSHRLDYSPRQLSVGQQQRVAVARALANRPRLVLADEPTGNLDAANADETLALLREACAEHGAALLLVSHDRSILERFAVVEEFGAINQPAPVALAS